MNSMKINLQINVFERRSGRAITGNMAPSAQQLKKWLQDNPSFEVVQPGSLQALEIEVKLCLKYDELLFIFLIYFLQCTTEKTSETHARVVLTRDNIHNTIVIDFIAKNN